MDRDWGPGLMWDGPAKWAGRRLALGAAAQGGEDHGVDQGKAELAGDG
jgi:hypothetical protein